MQPWTSWVAQNKRILFNTPLSELIPIADAFLTEVSGHYHSFTAPNTSNVPKAFKQLIWALRQLPGAGLPNFKAKFSQFL